MKLEAGMYIRTKHYGLFKILKIITEKSKILFLKKPGCTVTMADKNNPIEEEIIGEPSFDIINLIEVGDFVNGKLVTDIHGDRIYTFNSYSDDISNKKGFSYMLSSNIKSIVTKEQFESMKYEV